MRTASFLDFFTPSCHSSDHCSNLLLWYYWHPVHEGQLFGTGLSDKYLSTSLVVFPAVLFLPLWHVSLQKASRTALMFLNFHLFEQSGLMYLSGGSLAPSSLSSLYSKDVNWIALCRSNKAFILPLSSRESRALSNTSVRFVNFWTPKKLI